MSRYLNTYNGCIYSKTFIKKYACIINVVFRVCKIWKVSKTASHVHESPIFHPLIMT